MYQAYVERMNAAKSATEKRSVVEDMCRMFAFSVQKAYKTLHENGWESGRKKRKDAGKTLLDEKQLLAVAEMVKQGIRKNGKATLPVNVARSILQSRGVDIPVGDSRLRSLLRENNLSVADSRIPTPHQSMRTEYPNQVHFTDPSVCLLYFAPNGKQKIIGDDELYKNKNFLEGRQKCYRYVLTDHYSGSICVRYYAAMGETAANMYDFLLYAWGLKDCDTYVFHGVPELLIWDCGTGNLAKPITNALKAFNVKTKPHLPGNPRAKGQVENANNIVELHFESRLRFEPVSCMEELNEAAERWCAAYNANMIPHLDTRLKRSSKTIGSRTMLWQSIPKDKLHELPDKEICRQVFASGIQTRKVAGDFTVSITHPRAKRSLKYSLRDLQGILVGMEVSLQPVLVTEEPICIVSYEYQGEEVSYEIEPVVFDNAGFDITAPVYGENYKRPKDTAREKQKKVLSNPALESVMGPAHSFIQPSSPFLKNTEGTQIEVAETVHTHEILISATEMAMRIKPLLGHVPVGFIDRLRMEFPEGVPSNLLNDFVNEYQESESPSQAVVYKFA